MTDYSYSRVPGSSHGTMHCGACNKPITEGEYRYYQKTGGHDWRWVTHHRACTVDDPQWAKRDAAQKAVSDRRAALLDACVKLRDEYQTTDLDEVIADLEAAA